MAHPVVGPLNYDALKPWIEQGMTFLRDRVTPENLGSLLGYRPKLCI
jgi:hypothetical protein